MATLHVRNVPDPLYETLRRQAEQSGRSIGAEAIHLLEQSLATTMIRRPRWRGRGRRRSGFGPFQRFTQRARAAVVAAQDEARALGHDHVGTGHLLLGLLTIGEGAAFVALETLGLTAERVRSEVTERTQPAQAEVPGRIPFEPGAKRALELALRQALELGHDYIGTEHLLLGIVREGETAGAEIVRLVEADEEAVRRCVERAVAEAGAGQPAWPPGVRSSLETSFQAMQPGVVQEHEFHVVELEGSSPEWEARLNEAAAQGFELVEVVDRRAIFRRD